VTDHLCCARDRFETDQDNFYHYLNKDKSLTFRGRFETTSCDVTTVAAGTLQCQCHPIGPWKHHHYQQVIIITDNNTHGD